MKYYKQSNIKILFNKYRVTFIGPIFIGIVVSIFSHSFLPFIFMNGVFLFIILLEYLFMKPTKSIEFTEELLIIDKEEIARFELNKTIVQRVEHRSYRKGICIKSGKQEVYFWECEFSEVKWRKIIKQLSKCNKLEKIRDIYSSAVPGDVYCTQT